jgi:hypothetical protein
VARHNHNVVTLLQFPALTYAHGSNQITNIANMNNKLLGRRLDLGMASRIHGAVRWGMRQLHELTARGQSLPAKGEEGIDCKSVVAS